MKNQQKRIRSLNILSVIALIIVQSGCATFFGRKAQVVQFSSNVPKTEVYLDGHLLGEAPVTTSLRVTKKLTKSPKEGDSFDKIKYLNYNLQKKISYLITYKVEGQDDVEIEIYPKGLMTTQSKTNRALCIFDSVGSVFLLGIPIMLDLASNACSGFDAEYKATFADTTTLSSFGENGVSGLTSFVGNGSKIGQ